MSALDVKCPWCRAEPGERCHPRGVMNVPVMPHQSREEVATPAGRMRDAWLNDRAASSASTAPEVTT